MSQFDILNNSTDYEEISNYILGGNVSNATIVKLGWNFFDKVFQLEKANTNNFFISAYISRVLMTPFIKKLNWQNPRITSDGYEAMENEVWLGLEKLLHNYDPTRSPFYNICRATLMEIARNSTQEEGTTYYLQTKAEKEKKEALEKGLDYVPTKNTQISVFSAQHLQYQSSLTNNIEDANDFFDLYKTTDSAEDSYLERTARSIMTSDLQTKLDTYYELLDRLSVPDKSVRKSMAEQGKIYVPLTKSDKEVIKKELKEIEKTLAPSIQDYVILKKFTDEDIFDLNKVMDSMSKGDYDYE